ILGLGIELTPETSRAVPTITQQPRGTSVLVGSTVNLNVVGNGTGSLTYQWTRNSNVIAGATSAALSLFNIQKAGEGDYQAVLSDTSGSVTSLVARITVVTADIPGLTNNLVAHYLFEHNLSDSTGRGNDGIAGGSVGPGYTPSGRTGGAALDF